MITEAAAVIALERSHHRTGLGGAEEDTTVISRPARRRRWLTPTSVALLAIALGFAGFYAGVREEKTQATGSASTSSISRTAASRSSSSRTSAGAGAAPAPGRPRAASPPGPSPASTATRSTSRRPRAPPSRSSCSRATAINKTQDVISHSVRPGDTVTVQGTQGSGGTINSDLDRRLWKQQRRYGEHQPGRDGNELRLTSPPFIVRGSIKQPRED